MKIDCYLSELCGSYYKLRDNIGAALTELALEADVEFHTISYDDALRLNITGSPTIRVDGADLFEARGAPGIL